MKMISLSQGRYALVDDEDFEWLMNYTWHAFENKRKRMPSVWYAVRHSTWKGPSIYMHREIALRSVLPKSDSYDHKDGNGLNNQIENLRPCSQTQNNANRGKLPGCTSRFKGVSWFPRTRKWVVQLKIKGKAVCLGYFDNEEKAARAYDKSAKRHFGEFAKLNFP